MFKVIKKYQKIILAIFGVGLMITFVVQTGSSGGGGSSDPVVAHIGDDAIHAEEQMTSRRLWQRLERTGIKPEVLGGREGEPPVPAANLLAEAKEGIDRDPDVFLLLQREARNLGLSASNDGVEELMHNQVSLDETSPPELVAETRQAFAALLLVRAGYERGLSIIKTTEPQRQHDTAMRIQRMTLHAVTYDANEFKSAVPAPTQDQLKQQFDKYASFQADQPSEQNPFGFGYMYPPREMVEYLTLRRGDLHDAVKNSKDAITWEIEARKQYLRNTKEYPATRPSDDKPKLPLGIATQPTTLPTTRPLMFADYQQQIVDQLIDDAESKLLDDVQRKIATTLQADWAAYRMAVTPTTQPTTQPAAGPATPMGVAYGSPEYLPKLALSIQQEFKVLPQVNRFAKNWLSGKDLAGLPGIGVAMLDSDDPRLQQQPISFADYAIYFLDAFGHKPSPRDPAPTLSVLSPSPAMMDFSRNVHYFRIFAADPAHAAIDMAPFSQQIDADWHADAALKLARAQADKLLPLAKSSGLDAASASLGRKLLTLGPIGENGMTPSKDLPLKPESERILQTAALDLLKHSDDIKAGKAIAVVELPREGKVLLISPTEIATLFPPTMSHQIESAIARQSATALERQFRVQWFNPQEIEKRTNYRAEEKKGKSPTE